MCYADSAIPAASAITFAARRATAPSQGWTLVDAITHRRGTPSGQPCRPSAPHSRSGLPESASGKRVENG